MHTTPSLSCCSQTNGYRQSHGLEVPNSKMTSPRLVVAVLTLSGGHVRHAESTTTGRDHNKQEKDKDIANNYGNNYMKT